MKLEISLACSSSDTQPLQDWRLKPGTDPVKSVLVNLFLRTDNAITILDCSCSCAHVTQPGRRAVPNDSCWYDGLCKLGRCPIYVGEAMEPVEARASYYPIARACHLYVGAAVNGILFRYDREADSRIATRFRPMPKLLSAYVFNFPA